jgi:hypothetical protein
LGLGKLPALAQTHVDTEISGTAKTVPLPRLPG